MEHVTLFSAYILSYRPYYIYCVDNKKFLPSDDADWVFLEDSPTGGFKITQIGNSDCYLIAASSTGNFLQFGVSKPLEINSWKTLDEGNLWTITEAGTFDATEVYNQLGWDIPETPGSAKAVLQAATTPHSADAYDLQGRRMAQPVRGLYIRDGKKMVVK